MCQCVSKHLCCSTCISHVLCHCECNVQPLYRCVPICEHVLHLCPQIVFRPPLDVFDLIIHLNPECQSRRHQGVGVKSIEKYPELPRQATASKDIQMPVTAFNPAEMFLDNLQVRDRLENGRHEFDSHFGCGSFSGSSHASDLKIDAPVATVPGAWRYRVSAGTGCPSVRIL